MTAEYSPYNLFGTDIVDRLDPEILQIITNSRANHGLLEAQRYDLSPEELNAYRVLGQLTLAETVEQVFLTSGGDTPSLTEEEFTELLAAVKGISTAESAKERSVPALRAAKVRRNIYRKFDTKNLSAAAFKSIIDGFIVVSPRKTGVVMPALAPKKLETLGFIAQGLTTADIGRKMDRTEVSAGNYAASLLTELDAHSRPQVVYRAFESGVWQLPVEIACPISTNS